MEGALKLGINVREGVHKRRIYIAEEAKKNSKRDIRIERLHVAQINNGAITNYWEGKQLKFA